MWLPKKERNGFFWSVIVLTRTSIDEDLDRIDEDLDLLFVKNKNHMDCKLAKRKATLI